MKDVTEEFRKDIMKEEKNKGENIQKYYFHDYTSIEDIKRTIEEQDYWRTACKKDGHKPCGEITIIGFCTFTTQAHAHKNDKYSITDHTGRIMAQPTTQEIKKLLNTESRLARIIFSEEYILLPSGILLSLQKEKIRTIPILYATPEKGKEKEEFQTPIMPDTVPIEWDKLLRLEEMLV